MAKAWGGARATRIRAALALTLPAPCWRCGTTLHLADEWDVGHLVSIDEGGNPYDPTNVAPECRGQCNRAAGARMTNDKRRARATRTRSWS